MVLVIAALAEPPQARHGARLRIYEKEQDTYPPQRTDELVREVNTYKYSGGCGLKALLQCKGTQKSTRLSVLVWGWGWGQHGCSSSKDSDLKLQHDLTHSSVPVLCWPMFH
jgi:hypothetical protein